MIEHIAGLKDMNKNSVKVFSPSDPAEFDVAKYSPPP
jgi:hypothetical protein